MDKSCKIKNLIIKKPFKLFWLIGILLGLSLLEVKAQATEKLIKKFSDGGEICQRKLETLLPDTLNSEGQEQIMLRVEAILKTPESKQEEIIWHKAISFNKNERAFNKLDISDIYVRDCEIYLLYFEYLDLRVVKLFKDSNKWQSENDIFLEKTSESVNPIIESKFVEKKPRIIAKRSFGDIYFTIYEWKLKKDKWILIKEKKVKPKLPIKKR